MRLSDKHQHDEQALVQIVAHHLAHILTRDKLTVGRSPALAFPLRQFAGSGAPCSRCILQAPTTSPTAFPPEHPLMSFSEYPRHHQRIDPSPVANAAHYRVSVYKPRAVGVSHRA